MTFKVASSPHQHAMRNTAGLMRLVIYCAVPGIVVQGYFFGWGILVQLILAVLTALVSEGVFLALRKRNFERALGDYSAVLTAILLAISIPPLAPWWIVVLGTFFAIVIVKQLYGGLGNNLFNPAMAAYVMLLISFPVQMTAWAPVQALSQFSVNLADAASVVFTGFTTDGYSLGQLQTNIDGVTLATPLDQVRTDLTLGLTYQESLQNEIFNHGLGIGWAWVNLAYLLGGLVLIKTRAINWHIPGAMLGTLAAIAAVMYATDASIYASPAFHLFSGAAMLGAFFIATDPVSAATSNKGRLVYGAGIGLWVYLIRTFGGYPDAVAFAVLIMNMAVPLIDYYLKPRVYGHWSKRR